jgi:hypothetical protein
MSTYQKHQGAPFLYDEVTSDLVGLKDYDGSETLLMRIPDMLTVLSLANQAAIANTGKPIEFETAYISRGLTIVDDTKITCRRKAIINLQFSFVFSNTDNGSEHDVSVWIVKNGNVSVDGGLQSSNTDITIPKPHGGGPGKAVAAWNYFIEVMPGDYFEMYFSAPSNLVKLEYTAAQLNPPRPAMPSAILTVNEVDGHYP